MSTNFQPSNPYVSPQANLTHEEEDSSQTVELAGRGSRLVALIVEGLIGLLCVIPMLVAILPPLIETANAEANGEQADPALIEQAFTSPMGQAMIALTGFLWLAFVVTSIVLLAKRGQTVGKFFMKVQIAKFDTFEKAGFWRIIGLRGFVMGLLGSIPVIGVFFSLLNPFFIFRQDRRCLHDLIAGTTVIKYQD